MPSDSNSDQPSVPPPPPPPPSSTAPLPTTGADDREALIAQGVKFFQAPAVANAPWERQKSFLLGKGLTEGEISIAKERAEKVEATSSPPTTVSTTTPAPTAVPPPIPPRPVGMEIAPMPVAPPPRDPWVIALAAGTGITTVVGILFFLRSRVIPALQAMIHARHTRVKQQREVSASLIASLEATAKSIATLPPSTLVVLAEEERSSIAVPSKAEGATLASARQLHSSIIAGMYGGMWSSDGSREAWSAAVKSFREQVRSIKGGFLSRRNFPSYPSTR